MKTLFPEWRTVMFPPCLVVHVVPFLRAVEKMTWLGRTWKSRTEVRSSTDMEEMAEPRAWKAALLGAKRV